MIYQREEQVYKMMTLRFLELVMKQKRRNVKYLIAQHHQEKEVKVTEFNLRHQQIHNFYPYLLIDLI